MSRMTHGFAVFVTALALAPVPAQAQGGTSARLAALEARVAKLEGNIVAADLVGTYRVAALASDLDGDLPARVTTFAYGATATLAADGTGGIILGGGTSGAIELVQGDPSWTQTQTPFPEEPPTAITWSYADGVVHLSDGTANLDLDLIVGAGGRVLTWAGLGDDGEASIVIATRLQ